MGAVSAADYSQWQSYCWLWVWPPSWWARAEVTIQQETTEAASSESSEAASGATGGTAVALAEEILATFDEIAAKAADLAKDSPEPAVLKPQLEELYDSYMPTMTGLNGQYLALRDADVAEFGQCNSYLGENRGKHVTAKDNTLSDAVKHYNFDLGDQETVDLLSKRPVELLEVAVAQK